MTGVSFTLADVDVTELDRGDVVWWSCADCGADVELPGVEGAGFLVDCPDCPGSLVELWRWEPEAVA
jgi:hypothetical protein